MVEATHPRPDLAPRSKLTGPPLLRFDRAERVVHWVNATLFAIVMATALMLYIPPISAAIGRRELVVTVHVYAGLLLPFPLLLGAFGRRWGRRLRADLCRLNRWIPEDKVWFRRRGWRAERVRDLKQGKFNAGQKLNAAFTGGAILVMLATGSIMHWFNHFPLSWRTGATFVHDWIFIALFFTITGHVMFAVADKEVMNSMLTGTISRNWAKRHAPRWLEEEKATAAASAKYPARPTNGAMPTGEPVVSTREVPVVPPPAAVVSAPIAEAAVVPTPAAVVPVTSPEAAVLPTPAAVAAPPVPVVSALEVEVVPAPVTVLSDPEVDVARVPESVVSTPGGVVVSTLQPVVSGPEAVVVADRAALIATPEPVVSSPEPVVMIQAAPSSSQEQVVPATGPAVPTPDVDVTAPEVPESSGTAAGGCGHPHHGPAPLSAARSERVTARSEAPPSS